MISEIPLTSTIRIQLQHFGMSSLLFAGIPAQITQMLALTSADILLERFSGWVEKKYIQQEKDQIVQNRRRWLLRKVDKV